LTSVLITGCSSGFGRISAVEFARAGYHVYATTRNADACSDILVLAEQEELKLEVLQLDVTDTDEIKSTITQVIDSSGRLDVLINNAGKLISKPFLETSMAEFEEVFRVNVFGLAEVTKIVIPKMPKEGHVVTISSMGGIQGSSKFPGLSAYSSSKGAVITLTELWAEEFKETGPCFNALALGAVQTEMLAEAFPGYQAPTTAKEMAEYIKDFSLKGHKLYNGKVLQVSSSTP